MDSFISVPRAIFDDDAFPEEPFSRREAFLDLVQRATYKQITIPVKGGVATIERGELIVSIRKLAARWGWSKSKVEKVLDEFVSQKRIGHRTDGATTILSITNYDTFQRSVDTYKDTDQDANQDNINKENKENKVEKKDAIASKEKPRRFVPPSIEEVRAFCAENNYQINAADFVDFYESKGWVVGKSPMKDWKAAVRTWIRKDRAEGKHESIAATPTPPKNRPSLQEAIERAKNPTKEEKAKFWHERVEPFFPKNQGETDEEYRGRMKPIYKSQYKSWIEDRVLRTKQKYL